MNVLQIIEFMLTLVTFAVIFLLAVVSVLISFVLTLAVYGVQWLFKKRKKGIADGPSA